jgi:general L-amino acid transport system permease protein
LDDVPPFLHWAIIDADWDGTSRADCRSGGRLLGVRQRETRFILFGLYPFDEHWRPLSA